MDVGKWVRGLERVFQLTVGRGRRAWRFRAVESSSIAAIDVLEDRLLTSDFGDAPDATTKTA